MIISWNYLKISIIVDATPLQKKVFFLPVFSTIWGYLLLSAAVFLRVLVSSLCICDAYAVFGGVWTISA